MYESEDNLGKKFGYSRKQVGLAIDRLCKRGLLVRSAQKYPGRQTYSYSVCMGKVRASVTSSCDKTSQGDAKKVPTQMGRNVTSPCNLSSHHNEMDKLKDNQMYIESAQVKRKNSNGTPINPSLEIGNAEDFRESK